MKRVLLIDNQLDPITEPSRRGCPEFRRYFNDAQITVRRSYQEDLPKDISSFSHIVLSGSRASCSTTDTWLDPVFAVIDEAVQKNRPLLGVCFGHQIINRYLGGHDSVSRSPTPEFGWVKISGSTGHPLFKAAPKVFYSYQSHNEEVKRLAPSLINTHSSDRCMYQAFYDRSRPIFGVQFHPERNFQEGERALQRTIAVLKEKNPGRIRDAVFLTNVGEKVYDESIATELFKNFLKL